MAATATVTTAAYRILVVANDAADTDALYDALRFRARKGRDVDLLVVATAPISHARDAGERLTPLLEQLRDAGFTAEGLVADADPIRAIDDALALFSADEIVLATTAAGASNWFARDLVRRLRHRYAQPVLHVVTDAHPPLTLTT